MDTYVDMFMNLTDMNTGYFSWMIYLEISEGGEDGVFE